MLLRVAVDGRGIGSVGCRRSRLRELGWGGVERSVQWIIRQQLQDNAEISDACNPRRGGQFMCVNGLRGELFAMARLEF